MNESATNNPHATTKASSNPSSLVWGHDGEWWDSFLLVSLLLTTVAAAAVVISTAGSIVAHKRETKAAESELDRFKTETQGQIADANARALEAELALERFKTGRSFTYQDAEAFVNRLSAFKGQKYWAMLPTSAFDTEGLWRSVSSLLDRAGWIRVDAPGMNTGVPAHGVGVISEPGIHVGIAQSQNAALSPAAIALRDAFVIAQIAADVSLDPEAEKNPSAIMIVIGIKPQ